MLDTNGKCIFSWLYCGKIGIIHKLIIMSNTHRQKNNYHFSLQFTVHTVYSQEDHKHKILMFMILCL